MVFGTKWRADRYLYFRHAPPPTADDFFRDEDLPVEPFEGAPTHMRSVYYYWWAFAREHERYVTYARAKGGNPAALPPKFQPVRNSPDFMQWWDGMGRFLFCEKLERNVRVHKLDATGRITDMRNPDEKIILSLPAHGDLRRLLGEVEQLIIRERPNITATASWSTAEYPVSAKYVLASLHRQLELWKLRADRPLEPLHELSRAAGIELKWASDTNDQRAVLVSKYLRKADCIFEHLGKGLFPVTSMALSKKLTPQR